MFLFSKRKNAKAGIPDQNSVVMNWLRGICYERKVAVAKRLAHYDSKLTAKQRKMAVIVFMVSMSLFYYLPFHQLYFLHAKDHPFGSFESITVPLDSRLPDSLNIQHLRLLRQRDSLLHRQDSLHLK